MSLNPDAILFVGDLGDGDIRFVKAINEIEIPTAVILGNHDRGSDMSGSQLKCQLDLLGDKNCAWGLRVWERPLISVVGARPCSAGGGYFLSPQMKSVFGDVSLHESSERICNAAAQTAANVPLIVLAHSGPTGLGSDASSICGRDWKQPSIDWGDKDLELSIDQIRKTRSVDLVVFGHMHHGLKRSGGNRKTFVIDNKHSTAYLNAACVPRRGKDQNGSFLAHFSWVEFLDGKLKHASHRWYRSDSSLAYLENLHEVNI